MMLLDFLVAALGALGPALGLARSLPDPVAFERRWREKVRGNLHRSVRYSGLRLLLLCPLLFYAHQRAGLSLLWAGLAVLSLALGLIALAVSFTAHVRQFRAPEPEAAQAPRALLRSRRRVQAGQAAFVAIWVFAWRHLAWA